MPEVPPLMPEAPPLGRRIAFYIGVRLPVRYRDWVEADIQKPLFPELDFLGRLCVYAVVVGGLRMLAGDGGFSLTKSFFIILGVVYLPQVFPPYRRWIRGHRLRRQKLLWGPPTSPSSDGWREEIGRG